MRSLGWWQAWIVLLLAEKLKNLKQIFLIFSGPNDQAFLPFMPLAHRGGGGGCKEWRTNRLSDIQPQQLKTPKIPKPNFIGVLKHRLKSAVGGE